MDYKKKKKKVERSPLPSLLDPDAPPRGLNVTASSNGLRIAWEAPEILSGPTSYLVQVTEFHF